LPTVCGKAIAIQHLQRQLLPREFLLDSFQLQPHLALHHAFGGVVPLERPADEIVRAGVADVLKDGGIDVAQIDKSAGQALRGSR
jgi:hypothetical protein